MFCCKSLHFYSFFVFVQVETKDGYLLSVQRISGGRGGIRISSGPPVFLQHGLFMVNFLFFVFCCG